MSIDRKRAIKSCLGIGLIGALVYLSNFSELKEAFLNLSLNSIVMLLLLSLALIAISAMKWKIFLDHGSHRVSFRKLFELYLIGYFVNSFAPSYLGGDAIRSWKIGKKIGQHRAAAATILERFTGIVAMVILALTFVWFVRAATQEIQILIMGVAIALVVVAVLAVSESIANFFHRLLGKHRLVEVVFGNIRRVQVAIREIGSDKKKLAWAMLLSFMFHSLTVVNTVVAAHAIGWSSIGVYDTFVVLPLILLIGAIPLAPMGLGIQEGAFYFFLQGIGATPAQALAVALVLRAKGYLLALVGGVLLAFERESIPTEGTKLS